jgi:trehalose 6-phosphate phosphatase
MVHHERIDEFLRSVARAPASVLLLDYDGTLAPFVLNRSQATPYQGLTDILQKIMNAGRTRLVIVTGRDAHDIGPLLGLEPNPEVWGAHGLQRLRPDGACEMRGLPANVKLALDDARRWLRYQGLQHLAEIKPGSVAVHWRGIEDVAAALLRGRVLLGWSGIAEHASLKLLEFDGGVEMRMGGLDKGDVVRTIVKEAGPGVPIAYLGDDAADEHAFEALGQSGLTALVRPTPRQTSAQIWLKAPQELLEFLARVLAATEPTPHARSAVR